MKSLFKTAIVIAMLAFSGIANAQKLGHVNVQEVMQMMPERDSARVVVEALQKRLEKTMVELQTSYQEKLAKFQGDAAISEAEKQMLYNDLVNLEKNITEFEQNAQKELQDKEQELLKPMVDKVNASIEKIAKEKGYLYIFDVNVLHYKGGEDITPLVKKDLGIA